MIGRVVAVGTVTLVGLPLAQSEYLRWQYGQQVIRYAAHVRPPGYVFCGDSNVAAGRNWGRRMFGLRGQLAAQNLGQSGFTVEQVCGQARTAIQSGAHTVAVMCGTNDTFARHREPDHWTNALGDMAEVIELGAQGRVRIVVILPPLLGPCDDQWRKRNAELRTWHAMLRHLCAVHETPLIDVNPVIAPDGELKREYHVGDAVHLNDAALDLIAAAVAALN